MNTVLTYLLSILFFHDIKYSLWHIFMSQCLSIILLKQISFIWHLYIFGSVLCQKQFNDEHLCN